MVAGTVVMLIPVTLAPLILGKLSDVPQGASPAAAPVTVSVTLLVVLVTALRGSGLLRLWGPVVGIVAGTVTGALAFGLYDAGSVREAAWIGLAPLAYPGLDLGFGPEFWALLSAFVLVTVVGGDGHPRGRRRHPASVLAQAARHRFPVHPGRDIGRRSRQPGGGSPQTVRNSIDR